MFEVYGLWRLVAKERMIVLKVTQFLTADK